MTASDSFPQPYYITREERDATIAAIEAKEEAKREEIRKVFLRHRTIERMRLVPHTTPEWWDRDCRCCMARANNDSLEKDLFERRAIKGAGHRVLIVRGEEIHAWHTDQEIINFMEQEDARANS